MAGGENRLEIIKRQAGLPLTRRPLLGNEFTKLFFTTESSRGLGVRDNLSTSQPRVWVNPEIRKERFK